MEEEKHPMQSLIGRFDSLQTFRSEITESLTKLLSHAKPDSQGLSLPWIRQCFSLIPTINDHFAHLLSVIDHPMSRWDDLCAEEFMSYTLCLLDQLNPISSSISHLSQSRLWLSYALTLLHDSPPSAIPHLKRIHPSPLNRESTQGKRSKPCDDGSKKERIVHQAMQLLKNVGSWVCGVVLSGLTGNPKPYVETKRSIRGLIDDSGFLASALGNLDRAMEGGARLREVGRVNDAVARLEASLENGERCGRVAEELQRELKSLQGEKEKLDKVVDGAFSKILDSRNQLLATLRSR